MKAAKCGSSPVLLDVPTRHLTTSCREKEINEFLAQIEQLTIDLKQEEAEFVVKEKQLIQELNKYEQRFVNKMESTKVKEEELAECLLQLQVAEEEYTNKNRKFEELHAVLAAMTLPFIKQDKMKQELKQLRNQESYKIKTHFEILKNLENEIYVHDLELDALLLENQKLKENLVDSGDEILKEIKNLIDKLYERDENIEHISTWLQGNLEELHFLVEQELPVTLVGK
ncbi:hypothetical protein MC885_014852 [Smutsia gigantea]|nr:hypothetical protein MC885_014852 [Smutsia gigantea]